MSEPAPATSFLLRLRPSAAEAPNLYPVEVTIDGAGTFNTAVTINVSSLKPLESDPWTYGSQLGRTLFEGGGLQRALDFARGMRDRLSINLQLDAPSLQDLLWERVIVNEGGDRPWAASDTITLSRRIPSERPPLPARDGPFRLLLVLASPTELDKADETDRFRRIDAATEIGALRPAWDALVGRGVVEVTILARMPEPLSNELSRFGYRVVNRAATLDALADLLGAVDSLHLISHGNFKAGRATLLLENPDGGQTSVSEEAFLGKFGEGNMRLVFLQACKSATRQVGEPNVMSGLAPKLTGRAAAVVAMQDFVRIDDARRFAQEFYETLLSTGYAERAVNAGRRALYRPDDGNWTIPALYLAPMTEPLWQPDAILAAVQDLAEQLQGRPELKAPFPVEVIRQWPDVSSKMETSPPGPRVRVIPAVTAALSAEPPQAARIVVIAGNYGRAKTAQLYAVYAHLASLYSRDGARLPLFARMSAFPPADDAADVLIASAVAKTYQQFGIEFPEARLRPRLTQPFILCVDGDQDADSRRRAVAIRALREVTASNPKAAAVITLDEAILNDALDRDRKDSDRDEIPVLIVQLLSAATVTQYLASGDEKWKGLLGSIQGANLFDLAGVPWLLAQMLRQPNRGSPSRSGVIDRVVNDSFAATNLSAGAERLLEDLLGRVAWDLQTHQTSRMDGAHLYEILDQVRGRREVQLEQLKAAAMETKVLAPTDGDGVRFSYPGFQSFWCARHLVACPPAMFATRLNDITATLGKRSRVRLWEDTLVLLAGVMDSPESLIGSIVMGSMSYGEQAFLAARCISEARLASQANRSKKVMPADLMDQVLDTLIWRSTPAKESSPATRIRATESLGLLKHPDSIPHLVSIAVERVRLTVGDKPRFEFSGLRHAALQVLVTMADEAAEYVSSRATGAAATPRMQGLREAMDLWRQGDSAALRRTFETTQIDGLPALLAFALGSLGGADNLSFLAGHILDAGSDPDTRWSIADALLLFDPVAVTAEAIARMREHPSLQIQAAYMIGKLRVASGDGEEARFLVECLRSPDVNARGMALRALAQLGEGRYRELCEWIAKDAWATVETAGVITVPEQSSDRLLLMQYAIESLCFIGNELSLTALREARNWRPQGVGGDPDAEHLRQLSYEVSEDIYWRITSGREDLASH